MVVDVRDSCDQRELRERKKNEKSGTVVGRARTRVSVCRKEGSMRPLVHERTLITNRDPSAFRLTRMTEPWAPLPKLLTFSNFSCKNGGWLLVSGGRGVEMRVRKRKGLRGMWAAKQTHTRTHTKTGKGSTRTMLPATAAGRVGERPLLVVTCECANPQVRGTSYLFRFTSGA